VIALDPDPGQGHFFRSDHFPAAKAGVPAVSVGLPVQFVGPRRDAARARRDAFNGTDYHQTSDEIRDDWNYDGAVDDLRLLATIIWRLASDVEPPAYHAADPFALPRR
jgi:Zn-dependent M28 family amino/carboxypeptidase